MTKLPKLPEGETRCRYTGESAYTAEQTQAYANEAVVELEAAWIKALEDKHAWEDAANFHKERADKLQAALTEIEALLKAALSQRSK